MLEIETTDSETRRTFIVFQILKRTSQIKFNKGNRSKFLCSNIYKEKKSNGRIASIIYK